MEWIEAEPLPVVCQSCQEGDCFDCDYAGLRWQLSPADELRIRKKGLLQAIERMQRKVADIDKKLLLLSIQEK